MTSVTNILMLFLTTSGFSMGNAQLSPGTNGPPPPAASGAPPLPSGLQSLPLANGLELSNDQQQFTYTSNNYKLSIPGGPSFALPPGWQIPPQFLAEMQNVRPPNPGASGNVPSSSSGPIPTNSVVPASPASQSSPLSSPNASPVNPAPQNPLLSFPNTVPVNPDPSVSPSGFSNTIPMNPVPQSSSLSSPNAILANPVNSRAQPAIAPSQQPVIHVPVKVHPTPRPTTTTPATTTTTFKFDPRLLSLGNYNGMAHYNEIGVGGYAKHGGISFGKRGRNRDDGDDVHASNDY